MAAVISLLPAGTGRLLAHDLITAGAQTLCRMTIFFVAAAASPAFLTLSETIPLKIRVPAIAFFYAVGTGVGGIAGPRLFGALIDAGSRMSASGDCLLGSLLMVLGGPAARRLRHAGGAQVVRDGGAAAGIS